MLKRIREMFKNEKGLTLVELLAVIVILAIVGAIAFVFIGGIIDNSKKDAHIANAQQIISAGKLYEATEGDLPSAGLTIKALQEGQYLDAVLDPWDKGDYGVAESATVTKNGSDFEIAGFNANEADKCKISTDERTLLSGDRKAICETGS